MKRSKQGASRLHRAMALILSALMLLSASACSLGGEPSSTSDTTAPLATLPQTTPDATTLATLPQITPDATTLVTPTVTTKAPTTATTVLTQTLGQIGSCREEHTYGPTPCTESVITCTRCGYETDPGLFALLRYHHYVDGVCTECHEREEHADLKYRLETHWDGMEVDEPYYSICGIGTYSSPHLTTPETYCGRPVKTIAFKAFRGSALESVEILGNIISIEYSAFLGSEKLSRVTLHEGLLLLRPSAFQYCPALTEITLPGSLRILGASAFQNCTSLASVTCREGMGRIEPNAFDGCTALKSITLADSITSLGGRTFKGCTSLESITLPASYGKGRGDDYSLFEGCTALKSVYFNEGCLAVSTDMFKGCTSLAIVVLPASLQNVYGNAFEGCDQLTHVTYRGTRAAWMKVNVRSKYLRCDIHCKDGTLTEEVLADYFAGEENP